MISSSRRRKYIKSTTIKFQLANYTKWGIHDRQHPVKLAPLDRAIRSVRREVRCRVQSPPICARRPRPKLPNICGDSSNFVRWTLSLHSGRCCISSLVHRRSIGISDIGKVRKLSLIQLGGSFVQSIKLLMIHNLRFRVLSWLETKSQFARDDPAFLVLLLASLCSELKNYNLRHFTMRSIIFQCIF